MGVNFSLIVVRILKTKKRNSCNQNPKMALNDEASYGYKLEKVNDILLSSTRKNTNNLEALSEDESGICSRVVVGTSNNNFLKYRHQKIVSTFEI